MKVTGSTVVAHESNVGLFQSLESLPVLPCTMFPSLSLNNQRFSDLDILVEGDIDSTLLSSIAERIEESNLPIRVDIVPARDLATTYGASVRRDKVKVS